MVSPLLSASLGVAIALVHAGLSVAVAALALRQDLRTFMALYFGGMLVRMLLALAAVVAIVVWLAVDVPVFVGSLLGALIISMVLEITWLVRRRPLPQ